jgi:F0F1-type ATP synthase membrane subunit c/vacuolar-type H+-ATPase subunit K
MKKVLSAIIAIIMGGFMMATPIVASSPVFAEDKCVLTTVLGNDKCDKDGNRGKGNLNCSCDNGGGSSIGETLMLVINILSVAIGILAAIGIAIVGVQYLTAGGNEEKTRKSKRRLFEIVIGVVAYVLIYALLNWLIPSFK